MTGCRTSPVSNPADTYQGIRLRFLHGDLATAYEESAKAREHFSGSGSDWPMKFRLLEAEILTYQGRRPDVVTLLDNQHVSYPASGDLAIKRNLLLGRAHAALGQAPRAERELQQAQRLAEEHNSQLRGEVYQIRALVQRSQGHQAEAEDLTNQSLRIAHEKGDTFLEAADLLNLGMWAADAGHYDQALSLLRRSADMASSIQASFVMEAALGNVGFAYLALGDFEKALANLQQAEQAARRGGGTSTQIDWLADEGMCYYLLGNLEKARVSYEAALQQARLIKAPAEIADAETGLAFVLYRFGQFDLAKQHGDEAIRVAQQAGNISGELRPQFLRALIAGKQGEDAERLLLRAHDRSTEDPLMRIEIENALANYYAGKKRASTATQWYRTSIRTFEDQRGAVEDEELRLPYFANGATLYRDYADFLIDTHKQEQALQLLDIGRAKTLAEGLEPAQPQRAARAEKAVNVQAVAARLGGVILFYSLGPARSYLWAVTPHAMRVFVLPGQAEIKAQVDKYQKAILRSSDPLREANQQASGLYETLVGPASAMVPQGSRVFVIADGLLNGLNFETLLVDGTSSPHYWIEDVTISNASSVRLLSRVDPSTRANRAKKLMLFGNPIATGTGYDRLVNAFAEIRGIEKHFPAESQTVITQSGAIPAAYAANDPDQFQYIHFVAHGTASQLDPLDSAVVLSPPPGRPENFKLYARDIMRCPLHAELVTISACYGSGLRAYAGEGLVGLSWAFLRAGAHNVIGALWEVNDASTPLLMDRLYTELASGRRPDEALRSAKLSLIHSDAVYRKPLYWGGLQLYTGS